VQQTMHVDPHRPFPRRFVPQDADMGDWTQIEPLFRELLARPLTTVEALEQALLDSSELSATIKEERAKRYIAMTSQTDDPVREAAYLHFVEQIDPKLKPAWFAFQQAYLRSPARKALPQVRYGVLDRFLENEVALFREANVPLETTDALLRKSYQKTVGAMTVTFQGEEQTLQQMAKYLEEPNRALRQQAWELVVARRLRDKNTLEELYDQMLVVRAKIAANAGFPDYRDFAFRKSRRFDYTPQDCLEFHDAVEHRVLPLVRTLREKRRRQLGVEPLRPWDLQVDPRHRPPLRPFTTAEELLTGTEGIFRRVDPELGEQFKFMRQEGLLDLESRKGKAPGGYQSSLEERRWPFIFMNAVGLDHDVRTLLHEGGHAFHQLASRDEPLILYREPPLEFAEVASMGMEMLAGRHLDVFYRQPEDQRRAYQALLEDMIEIYPWIATIDAFQHWIYTHPGHTRDARKTAWVETFNRFSTTVDWSGYEDARDYLWQRQLHLFVAPFYYIEYGIALTGALQVWRRSREDYGGAVQRYWQALTLGGSRPLPELFSAAGATFRFDAATLAPLVDALAEELASVTP